MEPQKQEQGDYEIVIKNSKLKAMQHEAFVWGMLITTGLALLSFSLFCRH